MLPGLPWLTASLILGVAVGCIPRARPSLDGILKPGLSIAAKRFLRLGIVVLGLKLSLGDIANLGWVAIAAIVALVLMSFGLTYAIARLFRLEGDQPTLLAAGFSICGVSAVGAMAAARGSNDKDTATPITLVTLYGTLAIVVLPLLTGLLGLDTLQFGHWVGASVHDVGQVVATAQTAGAAALAVAIVVKLTRVLMLAPLVAFASIQSRRRAAAAARPAPTSAANPATANPAAPNPGGPAASPAAPNPGGLAVEFSSMVTSARSGSPSRGVRGAPPRPAIVPLFILGFLAAVLVRSFVPLPPELLTFADFAQSALLALALFSIGASLRLEQLARSGIRALAAGLVSWLAILSLALAFVYLT